MKAASAEALPGLQLQYEKLDQRVADATAALERQRQRLGDTGARLKEAGVDTANLSETSRALKDTIKELGEEQRKAAEGAQTFGEKAVTGFDAAGQALAAAGIAAAVKELTDGFAACVGIAGDFEAAMSTVEALSQAGSREMEALSAEAKELGATTKFTARESADAMGYMAMAGWDAAEMLSGMNGVLQLAAASGEDLVMVSDIVTDSLSAFGLTAADTAHFSDVLAAAATSSNTNVAIMGETFKMSASVAGALGYSIAGVDITKDLRPYLKSLTYTDNEEGEADDLQLSLQDREGLWLESWLTEAVEATAAGRLSIGASIRRKNWRSDGKDDVLPCGSFELDSVEASGPPAAVTVRATALPFSAAVRQTKKSRAWENYSLSGIAREIAGAAGLGCLYESAADPFYKRVEQLKTSDVSFLSKLCADAGISLKATDSQLVLFDQAAYEAKPPVMTIKKADIVKPSAGAYTKYRLSAGAAGTQYASCRVSYVDPSSGKCIEGTAQAEGMDAKSGQCLEISARVASAGEAAALAEKHLRLHNKLERTAVLTLPGNPLLVAGVTVALEGWGGWSGNYIISQARHTVAGGGYDAVRVLQDFALCDQTEAKDLIAEFETRHAAEALQLLGPIDSHLQHLPPCL